MPLFVEAPGEKVKDYLIARERLSRASTRKLNLYFNDPVAFISDCVDFGEGKALTPYQIEVVQDLVTYGRMAQRGPHGLGKTAVAALLVHWFSLTRDALGVDWKCLTTAGAWRQLEQYLWPEIHKWSKQLRWEQIGRTPYRREELLTLQLTLNFGRASAVASNVPAYIEGAHADSIMYIFDESKAVPDGTFDAAEGAFSGATDGREAFALASSTPGAPSGRFYDIHMHKRGLEDWHTRHVTLQEALDAKRLDPKWVEDRKLQWGEDSALYYNRVLGEFHNDDTDSIIPLSWVEAAIERWYENQNAPIMPMTQMGVDVARSGRDKTVVAKIHSHRVDELLYYQIPDLEEVAKHVMIQAAGHDEVVITIDADGVGAGVFDIVKNKLGLSRVRPFHAAEATTWRDRSRELEFLNVRAAAWWNLRELLDPRSGAYLELPDDDQLLADLSAPHRKPTARGKEAVEAKEDVKKRLAGRSTDAADAVIMGIWVKKKKRKRRMGNMGYGQDDSGV